MKFRLFLGEKLFSSRQWPRLPLANRRSWYSRLALIFAALITISLISIWLTPFLLSLYFQNQAGLFLSKAFESSHSSPQVLFPCINTPIRDENSDAMIGRAIQSLEKASRFDPGASQTYLLLGRAECALGNYENAVKAFTTYTQLRPHNPLGYLLLGFAHEALCDYREHPTGKTADLRQNKICANQELMALITREWKKARVTSGQFTSEGDRSFAHQDYQNAVRWYQRGASFGDPLSTSQIFKWSVAAILSNQPVPENIEIRAFTGQTGTESVQIKGEDLQWLGTEDPYWNLFQGSLLKDHPGSDPGVGILWWEGSSVTFVQVPCDSTYQLTVRAKHTSPSGQAGEMAAEVNLQPIGRFNVSQDWQDFHVDIPLTKGTKMIGIRYILDIGDLSIDWLRLSQTESCK